MKNIDWLNNLGKEAEKEFLACCVAEKWARSLVQQMPFAGLEQLLEIAKKKWFTCSEQEKLEAFAAHPQIGDVSSLKKKFATKNEKQHSQWSGEEQAQVVRVDEKILQELASYNQDYLQKFGFIFIICATNQTAKNMLENLKTRVKNSYETELKNASVEQNKITLLRINKLFN